MSVRGQVVKAGAAGVWAKDRRRARWLVVGCALGMLFPTGAPAAPNDTVVSSRTSAPGEAPDGSRPSGSSAVSGDGRYVAFVSESPNIGPGDPTPISRPGIGTGGTSNADVYVRDHLQNLTRVVSDGSTLGADGPSISPNGRFVLFRSQFNYLAPGDSAGFRDSEEDLYVRDMQANTVALVTPSIAGVGGGNAITYGGSISAAGRYITFASKASNLVAGDANGTVDVFVRDRDPDADGDFDEVNDEGKARTTIVAPNPRADQPSISPDGRYIAFSSPAGDLVAGDDNGKADVFVRDRKGTATTADDTTTLVSRAGDGALANDDSQQPSISADGRSVAFSSSASNLAEGDTNGKADIFVRDLRTNTTTLVSRASDGSPAGPAPAARSGGVPSISADGRFVSFVSSATDLVAGDTNAAQDVFVRDLQENTTAVASRSSGAGAPDAVFPSNVEGSSGASPSSMSADGRFVGFGSNATNLVAGDANGVGDVFRRELGPPPAPPTVSIDDVSVAEGNTGPVDATFTATLSKPSGQQVTVDFATANGSASAGEDYERASGKLTFAAGETSKEVVVKVNGDTLEEPDESFFVNLTNPDRASIADGQGVGTITNDDAGAAPSVSIGDASVSEPDSGTVEATFAVTLSGPSGQPVSVNFATVDGTATTAGLSPDLPFRTSRGAYPSPPWARIEGGSGVAGVGAGGHAE